jgi:predicted Zn-dependent protease
MCSAGASSIPGMGIQFEAPEGFFLTNSPRAVLIDGGEVRGQFGGASCPPAASRPMSMH